MLIITIIVLIKKQFHKKKVKPIDNVLPTNDLLDGYRFFDMSILSVVFDNIACPNCKSVGLCLDEKAKQGLAFKFILCCKDDDCLWSYTFFNSKRN